MKKIVLILLLIANVFPGISQEIITLTLQPGPDEGQDCYLNSSYGTAQLPYGNGPSLIASAYTYQGDYGIGRSLLRFDLGSIPPTATILSAKLSLFYNPDNSHGVQLGDNACYIKRITSYWDEPTTCWNTQPSYSEQNSVFLPTSNSPDQDYPEIDVLGLVTDMVMNPDESFGFCIWMINEIPYNSMIFASSDYSVPRKRPLLEVRYMVCEPAEAGFSYTRDQLTVHFQPEATDSVQYAWEFGDGYGAFIPSPVHTYQEQGLYIACLSVTNSCNTVTYCDTIQLCDTVNADFSFDNSNDRLVAFAGAAGSVFSWDFGDGFYSDLQHPVHYFNEYGSYEVCLRVNNDCFIQVHCETVLVGPNAVDELHAHDLEIMPNPSSSGFRVLIPVLEGNPRYLLTDLQGRVVIPSTALDNQNSIFIEPIPPGCYTFILITDTFAVQKKIISTP